MFKSFLWTLLIVTQYKSQYNISQSLKTAVSPHFSLEAITLEEAPHIVDMNPVTYTCGECMATWELNARCWLPSDASDQLHYALERAWKDIEAAVATASQMQFSELKTDNRQDVVSESTA